MVSREREGISFSSFFRRLKVCRFICQRVSKFRRLLRLTVYWIAKANISEYNLNVMENLDFLNNKYSLRNSQEVKSAAKRTEIREGKEFPEDPGERIQNYLDRFKEITGRKDPHERERGLEALKKVLCRKFVIKPEKIPETYLNSIKLRRRKRGDRESIEISDEYRKSISVGIVKDQEKSLGRWVDYLASENTKFPDWLKYYTLRNILKMGRYNKEREKFAERYGGAVAQFADINREALGIVLSDIEAKYSGDKSKTEEASQFLRRHDIETEVKEKYRQALDKKNFSKLYALAIEEFNPIPEELLKITRGKWIEYPKGSDYASVVESISDYGTGWCLKGESISEWYLENNNLYIYYSQDKKGNPVIPRVVMVVNSDNKIEEMRGVARGENLDPYIGEVVEEKLKEHPDGKKFEKESADTKLLTEIDRKTKNKESLSKDDLLFLYEINSPIEGFGYDKERAPRINEIRKTRNREEDMPIVFDCAPDQIAYGTEFVNGNTKAYIGEWNTEVFQVIRKYPNIKYFYESFPENKIFILKNRTNPDINSPGKAEQALKKKNIYLSKFGMDILYKIKFNKEARTFKLAQFTVEQLGFPKGATMDEIYAKAREAGLLLVPPDIAVQLALQYNEKDLKLIAIKQIADRDGDLNIFSLEADGSLCARGAAPDSKWDPDFQFVFSFREPLEDKRVSA